MELARPTPLRLESLSLNDVLRELLELHDEQLTAQKVRPVLDFAPDLPRILGDSKRLHRCLGNLVTNALQAMPQGGTLTVQTSRVEATLRPGEGATPAIQVQVRDTGVGIPADRLSKIFDPFYTTKEKGLGMGMAIAHRIIEDHRGTVDVESTLNAGTTFTLCFPIQASV